MNNGVILKTNAEAKNCGYGRYIRHKKDAASNQVTPDRGIRNELFAPTQTKHHSGITGNMRAMPVEEEPYVLRVGHFFYNCSVTKKHKEGH